MKPLSVQTLSLCIALFQLWTRAGNAQPGTVDPGFHPPADVLGVQSIVVQPDGKILVGAYDGTRRISIVARLNPDGSRDPSFSAGAGADDSIQRLALQPDGRILVGGYFTTYDGRPLRGVARLNGNGSLDTTFNPGTGVEGAVYSVALQSDGKILIAGIFASVNGTERRNLARLNPNGSLDASFVPANFTTGGGADPAFALFDVLVLPDNKSLAGGSFGFVGGVEQTGVARLNSDGSRDPAFVPPFFAASVFSLARQSDGFILAAGDFWAAPGVGIARLEPGGGQDGAFEGGICCASDDPMVVKVIVQEDGKIIVAGSNFHGAGDSPQVGVVRLNSDGGVDPTFHSGADFPNRGSFSTLALQDDGKILVGGIFFGEGGVNLRGILRLNNDDLPGFIKFAAASYVVSEAGGTATIAVKRTGRPRGMVTVHYDTNPGSARPGQDYLPRSGRLVFEDGETLKTFTIPIRGDAIAEGPETVHLGLRNPQGAPLGNPSEAILVITDGSGQ